MIHILAPDELDPALAGELQLIDSETGATRDLTVDEAALSRYRRGLADWQRDLAAFCAGRGWPYLPISTATPFEDVILNSLRRGGIAP